MTKKKIDSGQSEARREFLKFGATGVIAGLAGCAIPTGKKTGAVLSELEGLADPLMMRAATWQEPWVWRPELWPASSLGLNTVENQNPGPSPSPGNPTPSLFSYNGTSPGPTIRVRNDGELRIKLRNMLGQNKAQVTVGPAPDPADLPPDVNTAVCSLVEAQVRGGDPESPRDCNPFFFPEQLDEIINPEKRPSWNMKGHANGQHSARTTNLHTHGLHVFPQNNPDGSHSDNVLLRIIPRADWKARLAAEGPGSRPLGEFEHVGELDYKLQLSFESKGRVHPHPPGTHWYHPHSHGATHDQVASGMAGFLIVEGDVDASINMAMTGEHWPNPELPSGSFDYRERLIFIQRVFVGSLDLDAGKDRNSMRFPPFTAVNGVQTPGLMRMRPGAVERWRILNGSVDGAGTKRVMVLDGQFVHKNQKLWRVVTEGEGETRTRRLEQVSMQDVEDAKMDIQQLALDGITLVVEENGKAVHQIKDLSLQNAGTVNPMIPVAEPGENKVAAQLRAYEAVFKDGESLRNSFVRPNELYLTNANRADIFFKAPRDAAGKVFTIFSAEAHIHSDTLQGRLQAAIADPDINPRRPLVDVVVAYVHVDGEPVEGGDFNIQGLNSQLPPVPPLLQPVHEDELHIPVAEATLTGAEVGSKRTRTLSYSGTGGADFPLVRTPAGFAQEHPELENLVWGVNEGVEVLLPNLTRTMGINTEFDLTVNPEPGPPRKFAHGDPQRSRVLVNTAEEWVLYNCSAIMWAHTDLERFPQPGSYFDHHISYPLSRAEGQRRFAEDSEFRITAKGVDHPFHIHVNPMWVLRIDVPDETGELHNILPEPTWMDTVAIPRNGGRVVFRSRFDDFVGQWVNHCHILLHEDNGMMQIVECTDDAGVVNYHTRQQVASHSMAAADVDRIYPKPSLETMYVQNMTFTDPSHVGYQEYPGFELESSRLDDGQDD